MIKDLWKKIDQYHLGIPTFIVSAYIFTSGLEKATQLDIKNTLLNPGLKTAEYFFLNKNIDIKVLKEALRNEKSIQNLNSLISTVNDHETGGELYLNNHTWIPYEIPGKEQIYLKMLEKPRYQDVVNLTHLIIKDNYFVNLVDSPSQTMHKSLLEHLQEINLRLKILQNPQEDPLNRQQSFNYLVFVNKFVFSHNYTQPDVVEKMQLYYTKKPVGNYVTDFHVHPPNTHLDHFDFEISREFPHIIIENLDPGFNMHLLFNGKSTLVYHETKSRTGR